MNVESFEFEICILLNAKLDVKFDAVSKLLKLKD